MFDLSTILISKAFAETVAAPEAAPVVAPVVEAAANGGDSFMRFLPLILIFFVFYIFLIRPQQKKVEQQNLLIKNLKKGDKVVTSGGIVGTVTKLEGELYLIVEIAKGVEIKVVKSSVSNLESELVKGKDAKAK